MFFNAINFPVSTILAAIHKFEYVDFYYHLVKNTFSFLCMTFLTHDLGESCLISKYLGAFYITYLLFLFLFHVDIEQTSKISMF